MDYGELSSNYGEDSTFEAITDYDDLHTGACLTKFSSFMLVGVGSMSLSLISLSIHSLDIFHFFDNRMGTLL